MRTAEQIEQDRFDKIYSDIVDQIGDVLEELEDDTPISAIISAFGANLNRVFDCVVDVNEKRRMYDWFIARLRVTIGDEIGKPTRFNGYDSNG